MILTGCGRLHSVSTHDSQPPKHPQKIAAEHHNLNETNEARSLQILGCRSKASVSERYTLFVVLHPLMGSTWEFSKNVLGDNTSDVASKAVKGAARYMREFWADSLLPHVYSVCQIARRVPRVNAQLASSPECL